METKLSANCIYLADRIDVLTLASANDQANILLSVDNTRQTILDRRGDWFCPELVDAFMEISLNQLFWLFLEGDRVHGYATGWIARDQQRAVEFSDLRDLVHLFSVIVDTKSVFTREHSDGVASLARYIGELFELPERNCEMLELAGLLHDIGKLRVPDELLEKPGKLTPEEYAIVQQHSFDTFNILKTISGLSEITLWAAQHHERADGSDDYYHAGISLEAKIVAVADVFQALAQHRPYRQSMQADQIIAILMESAVEGKLDNDIVSRVSSNLQACWDAALPG
jgi:response regulator RpfG family c-di-GMP phosphodiesterase